MKVLLFQLDGKIPNLALLRIAAHHRALGDECELRVAGNEAALQPRFGDERISTVYKAFPPQRHGVTEKIMSSSQSPVVMSQFGPEDMPDEVTLPRHVMWAELKRLRAASLTPEPYLTDPIDEYWLKSVGFKWHQFDRQPSRQWLLWCGIRSAHNWGIDTQDIGVEVCQGTDSWFCWLRSDAAHRYSRFLHVRHMQMRDEVVKLVEAVTGLPWKPENHIFGAVYTGEQAAHHRAEWGRIDRQMLLKNHPWREVEKDDTRGGALPEHMEVAEGFAKRRGEK